MTLEEKITKVGATVAKFAVPITAAGLAGYAFLNELPMHSYNHRTAELGTHWPNAALALAGTTAAGRFTLPLLKKGIGLVHRAAEWTAEKVGAVKQTGLLASRLGLLSLAGYAAATVAGAAGVAPKSDYNLLNRPAQVLVDYVSKPSPEFWRNIKYLRLVLDPTKKIPHPPDDFAKFLNWHHDVYGVPPALHANKGSSGKAVDFWNVEGYANNKAIYELERVLSGTAASPFGIKELDGTYYDGRLLGIILDRDASQTSESSRLHVIDDNIYNIHFAPTHLIKKPNVTLVEVRTVTLYDLAQNPPVPIGKPIENCMTAYLTYLDVAPSNNPANVTVPAKLVLEINKIENGKMKSYHRDLKTGEDTLVETAKK